MIERSEYASYVEQDKRNIEAGKEIYKKRQSIVEHPYGILKRQWGFSYIMTKRTLNRASADVGLMFVAYNLRRLFNILDHTTLKKFFKERIALLSQKRSDANLFKSKIDMVVKMQSSALILKLAA